MEGTFEFDEERDVATTIVSDKPIVRVEELVIGAGKHVLSYDANGEIVKLEVHGMSKVQENALKTVRREFTATTGGDQVIGHLRWLIKDVEASNLVAQGDSTLKLEDARALLIESPTDRLLSISFPLSNGFKLGIAGHTSEKGPVRGFALKGSRGEERTFSWEWFDVDTSDRAIKLQEGGELKIEVAKRGSEWQVIRTDFLTDISVRITDGLKPAQRHEVDWRINISRGSTIRWPSLVATEVVAS